jgi:DNA ligase-1
MFEASPESLVLDGEILAWSIAAESGGLEERTGSALPFSALQKRLGRKRVSEQMIREVPVVYVAFDVLFANGKATIDRSLRERAQILTEVVSRISTLSALPVVSSQGKLLLEREEKESEFPRILRAPMFHAQNSDEMDRIFVEARARGNEGLMIKDLKSFYTPGRRGHAWLKMKRELATLDCVVTAVEFGHGKRAGVLSDYTFAVRATNGDLMNVGKAYSGLTDSEIAEMTEWFKGHTLTDYGHSRLVEPKIVVEVAFNNVMRSDRHESGFALRFPRIVRLRPDKPPEEADTVKRVEEIYLTQHRAV